MLRILKENNYTEISTTSLSDEIKKKKYITSLLAALGIICLLLKFDKRCSKSKFSILNATIYVTPLCYILHVRQTETTER